MKIGILLDGSFHERWVLDLVRRTLEVPGTSLAAVGLVTHAARKTLASRFFRVCERISEPSQVLHDDLFVAVDIVSHFSAPRVQVHAVGDDSAWAPDEGGIELLRRFDVDVWICVTAKLPDRSWLPVSRYGVWGLEIGLGVAATNEWAGAIEVATRSPVTMIRVVDYAGADDGVIYRSFGATVAYSARRNRLQALRKGIAFPARLLKNLTRFGEIGHLASPGTLAIPPEYPALLRPTVCAAVTLLLRLVAKRLGAYGFSLRWTKQWQVGYCFAQTPETAFRFDRLRYLIPPRDRFWADPFAVAYQGRHFVFLEELPYRTQKGRLVAIEVFEKGEAGPAVVVLERPYHLSYPFVFSWDGSLFMLPETAANRTVELYRCEEFPHRWSLHRVLLDNISAFDATLWRQDDCWWMFVTVAEPGADPNDELHLYRSTSPLGPWTAHRRNPVVSDVRVARSAGPLHSRKGMIYRPSQDCSVTYGHSVNINRIDVLAEDDYSETVVSRIAPGWRKDVLRTHTFGASNGLQVVDCMVLRRRFGQ